MWPDTMVRARESMMSEIGKISAFLECSDRHQINSINN